MSRYQFALLSALQLTLIYVGCGPGLRLKNSTLSTPTPTPTIYQMTAPQSFSYSNTVAGYPTGYAITPNSPTVSQSGVSYTITPSLPSGLSLNSSTGVISGTPSANTPNAPDFTTYTVTASNTSGTANTSLLLLTMSGYVIDDTVWNAADTANCTAHSSPCNLNSAMTYANTLAVPSLFLLRNGTYTMNSVSSNWGSATNQVVAIVGESQASVILDGASASNVFTVPANVTTLTLARVTMQNFIATSSLLSILGNSTTLSFRDVTFKNSSITANTTGNVKGALDVEEPNILRMNHVTFKSINVTNSNASGNVVGGGVYSTGCASSITISDSTFDTIAMSTTGSGADGAAIDINSSGAACPSITIKNSLFTSNSASGSTNYGGAIYLQSSAGNTANLTNNTFMSNSLPSSNTDGGVDVYMIGGLTLNLYYNTFANSSLGGSPYGIVLNCGGGTCNLAGNLMAETLSQPLCQATGTIVSQGGNYENETTSSCSGGGSDFYGTHLTSLSTMGLATSLSTPAGATVAVLPIVSSTSIAAKKINLGSAGCGTTVTTDARGAARPSNGVQCSIGAYEF